MPTIIDGSTGVSQVQDGVVTAAKLSIAQTWQDVTGSRVAATTYTNSTALPIKVSVRGLTSSTTNFINGFVAGVAITTHSNTVSGYTLTAYFEVPAGATYSVTLVNMTVTTWMELR